MKINKSEIFNRLSKHYLSIIKLVLVSIVCMPGLSCSPSHVNDNVKSDGNINSVRNLSLKMTFDVRAENHVEMFHLKELIPPNIPNVQVVKSATYSLEPDSIGFIGTNQYAYFHVNGIDNKYKIEADFEMSLYEQSEISQNSALANKQELAKYLIPEKYIESNSPEIKAVADTLRQTSDVETVTKTYFFVHNLLKYQRDNSPDTVGAVRALERGYGDCSEFSDLFVALLRANGIPSKSVDGLYVDYSTNNPWHAWAEVYLPKNGWVTFDPTRRHDMVNDGIGFVRISHKNSYIIFREQRKDPKIGRGSESSWWFFPARGNKVTVKDSYIMKTH